jgi:DNA-binding MarR family transcriptional regulator
MTDDRIIRNENTMDPAEAAAFAECYRLLRNEQTAIYELYARAHRLSVQELEVLTALWLRYPGWCTQSDIQLKLFVPKQRVSAIIKKFRRLGFVSLTPSPTDGRNQLVQLSPDG